MSDYNAGRQPCPKYTEYEEIREWWGAPVHQCPVCEGRRMFCGSCNRDHHDGGWETCKPGAYAEGSDES